MATETRAVPASVITYSIAPGSFFPVGTTIVTATATNAVGVDSCHFTVTVTDNEFPVLTGVPANVTVECNAVPAAANVTATDNCATSVPSFTETRTGGSCAGHYTLTRTWVTIDASGNRTTASQVITVQDTQKPVLDEAPANVTVDCNAVPAAAILTATDNCSIPAVTFTEVRNNGTLPGNYTLTRTWTATDVCGNSCSKTQVITIVDNTKPVISYVNDITVNCGASTLPAATGTATATDACSIPTVTYTDVTSGNKITRTWKATDEAGNYSTSTQTITFGSAFTATVSSVPTSNTYTGGNNNNLYIGYGAQSTTLQICSLPSSGAPYTYAWSGSYANKLNSTTNAAPVFTPSTFGYYTFSVTVTNKYGCTTVAMISICVTDIRVPGSNGKVYVCHAPPGNPNNRQTLSISVNAVDAHLTGHSSDRLGSCDQSTCNTTIVNATAANSSKATGETVASSAAELKVTVMPNPTTTFFTLKLESKFETPVSMRVMDARGRVVDAKSKIGANSTIQIGHNYSSGIYYAELIQGNTRKLVQMVKGRS